MIDLSIVVPGIRTHLWERLYKSIEKSFRGSWEIVFVSPFDLPDDLKLKNVRHIKSYDTVTVCLQRGSLAARGICLCHFVDDGVFNEGALTSVYTLLDVYGNFKDAVCMTYTENTNSMTNKERWSVKNLPEFHLPGISLDWLTFVQPFMFTSNFRTLGGMECKFKYSNHAHHSLAFRLQAAGGRILVPDFEVSKADHMPERTGDHAPIHNTQTTVDLALFNKQYEQFIDPYIPLDNYKDFEGVWKDRFSKKYGSYKEMCSGEGYSI